jgi:hypothetical protein
LPQGRPLFRLPRRCDLGGVVSIQNHPKPFRRDLIVFAELPGDQLRIGDDSGLCRRGTKLSFESEDLAMFRLEVPEELPPNGSLGAAASQPSCMDSISRPEEITAWHALEAEAHIPPARLSRPSTGEGLRRTSGQRNKIMPPTGRLGAAAIERDAVSRADQGP